MQVINLNVTVGAIMTRSSTEFLANWSERYHDAPADEWIECHDCDGAGCSECDDGYLNIDELRKARADARAEWRAEK